MIFSIDPAADNYLPLDGKCVAIKDLGGATGVTAILYLGHGRNQPTEVGSVSQFDSYFNRDEQFGGIAFKCTGGGNIELVVSNFQIGLTNGANVTATIAVSQLPLATTTKPETATSVNNNAQVAVDSVGEQLAAANAARTSLRFHNFGPDPVAIGGAGLTWGTRCVVLQVDDDWVENDGANVVWRAITDAAKNATVGVQEVIS